MLTPPRPYYEAMIEAVDTELGRLLQAVDLATTTIIVIGDNGTPAAVLAKPYNADHGKSTPYEQGIRVPMMAAGFGVTSGVVLDQLVAAVDLYPTILQLAGIDYRTVQPDGIKVDGVSPCPLTQRHQYLPGSLLRLQRQVHKWLGRRVDPCRAQHDLQVDRPAGG